MEDASIACDFLCSDDSDEARKLLKRLLEFNEKRKNLENTIVKEAEQNVNVNEPVLVVSGDGWHEGVVGIVAARLARHFERPTIVLSCNDGYCKGSGRSFGECNLFSLIDKHKNFLEKFGGHKTAVGLSLEKEFLYDFREVLIEDAYSQCEVGKWEDPDILGELPRELIGRDLYDLIKKYEPYGMGNQKPKFLTRKTKIVSCRHVGAEKNHMKVLLNLGNRTIEGIQFNSRDSFEKGESADIVYTLMENSFNGRRSLQLLIEKISSSKF
jgi:single-stranded-DNA-specific exonuclease